MLRIFVLLGFLAYSLKGFADPTLAQLLAEKRCTPATDKPNAYDCMVDQPDGSVKKVRYLRAAKVQKPQAPESSN